MNNLGAVLKAKGERGLQSQTQAGIEGAGLWVRVGGLEGDVGLPGASSPTLNVSATRAQD